MARTREFDLDRAVQQAMEVFWARGYAATSMADIYAATGLKPGSLYAAVDGKAALFTRAFDAYAAHFRASLPVGVEGLEAIRAWIDTQVRLATEDPGRRGCLIVNTVLEREQHTEANRALAQARLAEIRSFFLRHLVLGAERGELAAWVKVEREADALLGAVVAIMNLGRAGVPAEAVRHVGEAAVGRLGASGRKS